jgi:hypothetical protein
MLSPFTANACRDAIVRRRKGEENIIYASLHVSTHTNCLSFSLKLFLDTKIYKYYQGRKLPLTLKKLKKRKKGCQ